MYCPNCGTQNADSNKFCIKCGTALPTAPTQAPVRQPVQSQPYSPPISAPRNPLASAATTGGLAGLAGGVLTVIGWLMPWTGIGLVNGLQITVTSLTGGLAALGLLRNESSGLGALLGCLGIAQAAVFASIPLIGISCVRTGIRIIEYRSSTDDWATSSVSGELGRLRSRSAAGFVLMLVIYVLSALIPFAQLLLSNGYFVAGGGLALAFLGALFAQSQISASDTSITEGQSTWDQRTGAQSGDSAGSQAVPVQPPQLTQDETWILEQLASGLSDAEIADKLGMSPGHVSMMTLSLFGKFGAKSKTELVERAKEKGLLKLPL